MREKLAYATAYFLSEGLSHGRCFQSLYKDHVVKDGECGLVLPLKRTIIDDPYTMQSHHQMLR